MNSLSGYWYMSVCGQNKAIPNPVYMVMSRPHHNSILKTFILYIYASLFPVVCTIDTREQAVCESYKPPPNYPVSLVHMNWKYVYKGYNTDKLHKCGIVRVNGHLK